MVSIDLLHRPLINCLPKGPADGRICEFHIESKGAKERDARARLR